MGKVAKLCILRTIRLHISDGLSAFREGLAASQNSFVGKARTVDEEGMTNFGVQPGPTNWKHNAASIVTSRRIRDARW